MSDKPLFSLIVWAPINTDQEMFKNMLESIDEQEFREFELYLLDESRNNQLEIITKEFFPDIADKIHYRKLKNKKGGAYAYNIGSHFAEGDYLLYLGCYDRLSPNTLKEMADKILTAETSRAIFYTDHDELIGQDRMNPHFKGGFNKELLLHTPYIGDAICVSAEVYKNMGAFNENAKYAFVYEYILRCVFKGISVIHVPGLLYHKRVIPHTLTKEERKEKSYAYKEAMALAESYVKQSGVDVQAFPAGGEEKWIMQYSDEGFTTYQKDYIFLNDEKVRMLTRKNLREMYSYLRQPDVAVVGIRFLGRAFSIDNVGYIHDGEGNIFPAFHGQKIYHGSYEGLANISRDVAMVDPGYCIIDKKIYNRLHGFDKNLSGRDAMLDFCMRAKAHGYRTIVATECVGKYRSKQNESTEDSHLALLEKNGEALKAGDKFYNPYLPMGMVNYVLPGMESE